MDGPVCVVEEGREEMTIFSIIVHPDISGMAAAHVIGMVERFLK